jgi:hypothetical protein
MKLLYGLAGIAILVSAVPLVPTNAQGSSGILISEINWAGSEKSQADEWIELVNTKDTATDISGWLLVGAATGGDAIALPDATILQPQQTLLIANYKSSDEKSTLSTEPNLVTTALSLANSSLHVFLTDPHGLVHDSYEDTGTPDFGSTSPIASIERDIVTKAWQNSVTTLGLTVETQFGTPGHVIFTALTENEEESQQSENDIPPEMQTPEIQTVNTESTSQNEVSPPQIDTQISTEENTADDAENSTNISEESSYEFVEIIEEEPYVETTESEAVDTDSVQNIITQTDTNQTVESTTHIVEIPENETPENIEQEEQESPHVTPKRTGKAGEIRINEIVSAPSTGDEWIEIYNTTQETFTLDGWTITDASGKATVLSGDIAGNSYLIIKNPAGKLNNDGDELTIRNEYADVIDTLTYGTDEIVAPEKDQSLNYTTNGWLTGTPSPNQMNTEPTIEPSIENISSTDELIYAQDNNTHATKVDSDASAPQLEEPKLATTTDATNGIRRIIAIAQPVIEEGVKSSTSSTKVTTKNEESVPQMTTTEIAKMNHGDKVSVTGTVIMEPMKIAKQVMYLEGLEIYFHAADWSKLPVGSSVTITGIVDHESTNSRIKVANAEDIVLHGTNEETPPMIASVADLAAIGSGRLVTISGDLSLLTKTGFTLKTKTGDIAVNVKAASDVTSAKLTTGAITVTGVLVKNKAGAYEVYPRSLEDLKQDTATKTVPSTSVPLGTIAPTNNAIPVTAAGISLSAVALGLMSYWLLKTKPELLTSLTSHLETYVR